MGWIGTVKSFQSSNHHLHGSRVYWDISELLKNKNMLSWSQQFFTIYKFAVTGVFFSPFFISMQLVHYIKPLSPHSMQRRCFFHIWTRFCKIQHRIQAPFSDGSLIFKGFCRLMSMMTSQILISVDFRKTQKPRYLKKETLFFLQIKKFINYTSRAMLSQKIVLYLR